MKIREMRASDIDGVMAIEKVSFPTPWSRRLFDEEIGRPFSHSLVACGDDGALVGYAICWIVAGEAHLLNIAVDPAARGKGIGRALVRECIGRGAKAGAEAIYLEVRPSNRIAIRLYGSEGFVFMGVRKRYYTDTGEDAMVFVRTIEGGDVS